MGGRQNAADRSRLPAWRGEAEDTWLARESLLTQSREREGNEVSHDARKKSETADVGAHILILISQRWQVYCRQHDVTAATY